MMNELVVGAKETRVQTGEEDLGSGVAVGSFSLTATYSKPALKVPVASCAAESFTALLEDFPCRSCPCSTNSHSCFQETPVSILQRNRASSAILSLLALTIILRRP